MAISELTGRIEVPCAVCDANGGWWGDGDGVWYVCNECDGTGWVPDPKDAATGHDGNSLIG